MGIKAPGRKRSRRLHRKISGRKIGYKLHYGLTEDYFKLTGVSDLLCGYARSPRVDSKLASGMARIYCLCQHSPHGRYDSDGLGVCVSDFPMPGVKRCEHRERFLLDNRRGLMDQIDGVRFSIGTPTTGMSGYVRWGGEHLKVDVYLGKPERDYIREIVVHGTVQFSTDEAGGPIEVVSPIPLRKRKNVMKLLLGMENHFLRELKDWSFVNKESEFAYFTRRNFGKRIRIAG